MKELIEKFHFAAPRPADQHPGTGIQKGAYETESCSREQPFSEDFAPRLYVIASRAADFIKCPSSRLSSLTTSTLFSLLFSSSTEPHTTESGLLGLLLDLGSCP